ncbi:MAG: pyruvate kinase, partial [Candidatus Latescibacterota bacterium]
KEMIRRGVDVFRINTAHGDRTEHQKRVDAIRGVADDFRRPVAILVDLAGPKIRLGKLPGDQLNCEPGLEVRFVRGDESTAPTDLVTTYEPLVDELTVGAQVMLADGTVALDVTAVSADAATCTVVQPGIVRSSQGVNLPGLKLSVPTLGEADRDTAAWAAETGADFVSLSFVRSADDVGELKELIQSTGSKAQVVAKIEKPEALDDLDAIVDAADGIMIARGDLGVEIDVARVPIVQKQIITTCRRQHTPVIVATQMLESMHHSRVPTRAETTDVANAILDGADACMLSGETAIGDYPCEAVEMMARIARVTEQRYRSHDTEGSRVHGDPTLHGITTAVADASGQLAEALNAKMIIVASRSGATARAISNHRLFVPTVGVSDSDKTLRRMCLYWGVTPLTGCPTEDPTKILDYAVERAREIGYVTTGHRVVMIAGTGLRVSQHNMVVVHELD